MSKTTCILGMTTVLTHFAFIKTIYSIDKRPKTKQFGLILTIASIKKLKRRFLKQFNFSNSEFRTPNSELIFYQRSQIKGY